MSLPVAIAHTTPPDPHAALHTRLTAAGTRTALGIVCGDIGTSPLYTVRRVFVNQPVTEDVGLGTVPAIIWTLTLRTTSHYVLLALCVPTTTAKAVIGALCAAAAPQATLALRAGHGGGSGPAGRWHHYAAQLSVAGY